MTGNRIKQRLRKERRQLERRVRDRVATARAELSFNLASSERTVLPRRDVPIVVTLTSYGVRLERVHLCIETLLRQRVQPDHIVLWLADDDLDRITPHLRKQMARGLDIRTCPDWRSYKKLVPALEQFPDAKLVTCDDDFLYPPTWLEDLVRAARASPDHIHCHRAHLMRHQSDGQLAPYATWDHLARGVEGPHPLLFPTTGGGVLIPPGALPEVAAQSDLFLSLAPTADDVWFKAMTLLAGRTCSKVRSHFESPPSLQSVAVSKLWSVNREQNDAQIARVFAHFGITT